MYFGNEIELMKGSQVVDNTSCHSYRIWESS